MCLGLIVVFFFPPEILRIIQLDLDLKYKTNIRELFEEFDNFLPGAVIGIAREMQPVYRCVVAVGRALGPCPIPHSALLPLVANWDLSAHSLSALSTLGAHLELLLTVNSTGRWLCPELEMPSLSFGEFVTFFFWKAQLFWLLVLVKLRILKSWALSYRGVLGSSFNLPVW